MIALSGAVSAGRRAALFATAAAFLPAGSAFAADCQTSAPAALQIGTVAAVPPGAVRAYGVQLKAGEGIIVDLSNLTPKASEGGDGDDSDGQQPAARALRLCDDAGKLLAPMPGEVFAKGGSVTSTPDGERLRFLAPAAGHYVLNVAADAAPREVLARRRDGGLASNPVITATLGTPQKGVTSSGAPVVYAFAAPAGQWVELKSTSEKDTLLRLAAPDRAGAYAVIAENDDTDGLNPVIRRKLPVAGTYFVQVDSLSDEPGEFNLTLARIDAPKPPPPPVVLRAGATVAGRLADGDDVKLYALPVVAGRSYRLDLTAPYDGVVAIGVPNPVEPEDGNIGPDAGFAEVKAQDSGTTGTERLSFTARANGQLLVRVKSFGIDDSDGGYTLTVNDLGG